MSKPEFANLGTLYIGDRVDVDVTARDIDGNVFDLTNATLTATFADVDITAEIHSQDLANGRFKCHVNTTGLSKGQKGGAFKASFDGVGGRTNIVTFGLYKIALREAEA